jgi:RNA methyltransferase, TrmH family
MAVIKTLTSKDNPAIKALRALAADSREARRQGRTLIDGPHLVTCYLQQLGAPQLLVVSDSAWGNAEIGGLRAEMPDVETLRVPDGLFREISNVAAPVGVLAAIAIPEAPTGAIQGSCVILDAVQDAGNVGAILRTAAAAGIRNIVIGPGCAGVWTPRVLRAAQGAHFGLRIRELPDLVRVVREYTGSTVATVARDGVSIFELDVRGNVAWIFGNEGAGVSAELAASTSLHATIPLASGVESLNVAAAAAICLFEGVRQRLCAKGNQDA